MIETLLLTLFICHKKGYNLSYLWKEKVFYPLFVCETFYWVMQILIFNGNYAFLSFAALFKSLYLCSTLFIVYKYELYKYAIIGSGCVILGGWCNDIAIWANDGKMPVFPSLSYWTGYATPEMFGIADQLHSLGNGSAHLKFLTDFIDLGYSVLSIGDVLIRVLPFIIIYQALKSASTQSLYTSTIKEDL